MKIVCCLSIAVLLCAFKLTTLEEAADAKISSHHQASGWEILFDGNRNSMEKWRGKSQVGFPSEGWKVEDGLLFLDGRGGDIITKDTYGSFELIFDFKLTEGANSGVKYLVDTLISREDDHIMVNGPEYQIIDDYNHREVKEHVDGLISTGSVYLLYAPKNKKLNPSGQWNTGKIIVQGNSVEHWLNGDKVVTYQRGSKDFLDRKAKTKFKNDVRYGELESGHILLTDHHDKVYFRNIKIRRL